MQEVVPLPCYMPLEQHLWPAYLPFLEIDTLTGPEPVTVSTQLLIVPCVLEAVSLSLGRPVRPPC